MESFKRPDLIISLLLITGSTIFSLFRLDYTFIYCYFITGGWQGISMLIHSINGSFTRKKNRRYYYHCTVAIIIAMGLLSFVTEVFALIYLIMFFAAPIMAISYTHMCYEEVKEIKQRHLLALK